MNAQVVVSTVGHTFELLNAEGEFILDVISLLGIKCAVAIGHIKDVKFRARNSDFLIKTQTCFQPFIRQTHTIVRMAEILDLHLLKFTRAKCVVAWIDFVAERFTNLRDAEG